MEVSMRRRTVLQFASVQAETENHEKRRNLALRCQLQPVHAAHPSFTNVDHSKKAAQHLVAASLQSRPAWTTGQRASLPDTRRFAKSQLLLRTAMPWAASNCKFADKMNTTVTTMSSLSDVFPWFFHHCNPSISSLPSLALSGTTLVVFFSQPMMATSVTAPAAAPTFNFKNLEVQTQPEAQSADQYCSRTPATIKYPSSMLREISYQVDIIQLESI